MTLLQMSVSAAILIAVIALIRHAAIHRLPKIMFPVLWAVVVVRLVIPVSIPSPFSIYSLADQFQTAAEQSMPESSGSVSTQGEPDHAVNAVLSSAAFPVSESGFDPASVSHFHLFSVPGSDSASVSRFQLFSDPGSDPPSSFNFQTISADGPDVSSEIDPTPSSADSLNGSPVDALPFLWLVGALLSLTFFAAAYLRCLREFSVSFPVTDVFVNQWKHAHPLRRRYQIRQSDRINSPLTYGLFRPVILLPKRSCWEDTQRMQYVLLHEYSHIRHFDTAAKLILSAVLCLHWFNPMVWLMYVLANRDLELICDETVIRSLNLDIRSSYALTLLQMEEEKTMRIPLYSGFSGNFIKERITAIMKTKKTSVFSGLMAVLLTISITGMFATSAVGQGAAAQSGAEQQAAVSGPYISDTIPEAVLQQARQLPWRKLLTEYYGADPDRPSAFDAVFGSTGSTADRYDKYTERISSYLDAVGHEEYQTLTVSEIRQRTLHFLTANPEAAVDLFDAFDMPVHYFFTNAVIQRDGIYTTLSDPLFDSLQYTLRESGHLQYDQLSGNGSTDPAFFWSSSFSTPSASVSSSGELTLSVSNGLAQVPFSCHISSPAEMTVSERDKALEQFYQRLSGYEVQNSGASSLFLTEAQLKQDLLALAQDCSNDQISFSIDVDHVWFCRSLTGGNELSLEPDYDTILVTGTDGSRRTVTDLFRLADLFYVLRQLKLEEANSDEQHTFTANSNATQFVLTNSQTGTCYEGAFTDEFLMMNQVLYRITETGAKNLKKAFDLLSDYAI